MRLSLRILVGAAAFGLFAVPDTRAQSVCNTWQLLPSLPLVEDNPITGFAYDPATQDLFLATQEGPGGLQGTQPWVGRRVGSNWVTVLDPATFSNVGNQSVHGLARLDLGAGSTLYAFGEWTSNTGLTNVARWNGSAFVSEPSPGMGVRALTVFDDGGGPALVCGGFPSVRRLVAGSWVTIGALSASSVVNTLVVHDDGTGPALYAGGKFTSIDGVPAVGIARWNGTTWSALGTGIAGNPTMFNTLGVLDLISVREEAGPRLYAAGSFLTMDGQPANSLACWDGTSWTGVGTGIPLGVLQIGSLAWFDRGTGDGPALLASGTQTNLPFTTAFVWSLAHGVWSDFFAGTTGIAPQYDASLFVADLPETSGTDLLAAVSAQDSLGIYHYETARFEACGETGRVYCLGDGSSLACPCANESPTAARAGCLHSGGLGGALRASGRASLSNDTLRLAGSDMNDGPLIYYQGTQPMLIPFGDGFICAGGAIIRLRLLFNSAGASTDPEPGGPPLSAQGFLVAPGTRYYSARYRDGDLGYCTSGTFNYTNGVAIVWSP